MALPPRGLVREKRGGIINNHKVRFSLFGGRKEERVKKDEKKSENCFLPLGFSRGALAVVTIPRAKICGFFLGGLSGEGVLAVATEWL